MHPAQFPLAVEQEHRAALAVLDDARAVSA